MTEIYENIKEEIKQLAETSWNIAMEQKTPANAANFLNNVLSFYEHQLTEEEYEFLQFYFKVRMEMIKR